MRRQLSWARSPPPPGLRWAEDRGALARRTQFSLLQPGLVSPRGTEREGEERASPALGRSLGGGQRSHQTFPAGAIAQSKPRSHPFMSDCPEGRSGGALGLCAGD